MRRQSRRGKRKGVILASFWLAIASSALLPLLAARSADAAEIVTAIEVRGNRTLDAQAIRPHLQLAEGSPYDPAKADQSLKAMFATGYFSDVRIERHGARVVVTVVENPVISRVSFEGNSAFDKTKVEEPVELKAGARYTRAKAQADAVKLREAYRRAGRLATTVEPKAVEQADGRVELTFAIKEGDVTKIDSISFRGNSAFTEGQLRDVISTSESSWFDFLKSAAFYDAERLDLDRQLLIRHYQKKGCPDATVVAPEAIKNEQGTGYRITFVVDEGDKYAFGSVTAESRLTGADASKLVSQSGLESGAVYNQDLVEKSKEKL